jgi:hypothetical protein
MPLLGPSPFSLTRAPFALLPQAAQDPASLRGLLAPLEGREIRMTDAAYGLLLKRPIDDAAFDSYVPPCLRDDGVLHDAAAAMHSASTAVLHDAGHRLIAHFERPVLFAWPPEDQPQALARAIATFAA